MPSAIGEPTANYFMQDLASRVASRIQITTDGHKVYADAVEGAFGADVDYAMLIKLFGNDSFDLRYSSGDCIGTCTAVLAGSPDPLHISTSFVERQNLAMRMSIRRFARLTNAFSKKVDNHAAAIALHFMHYNFCRVHKTLRVTPMEAGLAHRVWTVEELVSIIPEPVAKSRGPYRPRIQGDAQPTLTGDRRLRTPASLSTNIFSFKALQYKTPFIAGVHRFKTETPSPKTGRG